MQKQWVNTIVQILQIMSGQIFCEAIWQRIICFCTVFLKCLPYVFPLNEKRLANYLFASLYNFNV